MVDAVSEKQLGAWLRFVVAHAWGLPDVASHIDFERIAMLGISWEENKRRIEEKYPEVRTLRLQQHFMGLPGETRDHIDFLAMTDTAVTFEENVQDIVDEYHLAPSWEEMSASELAHMEKVKMEVEGEAQVDDLVDELSGLVREYTEAFPKKEKQEIRSRLLSELLASFTAKERKELEPVIRPYVDELLEAKEEGITVTGEMVEDMMQEYAGEETEEEARDHRIRPKEEVKVEVEEGETYEELLEAKEIALEERNKRIADAVNTRLAREHPDVDIEVSITDSRVTLRGFVKEAFYNIFGKKREFEQKGRIDNIDKLVEQFTRDVNTARGQEFQPKYLRGGLKLLFKCDDMDTVFDVVERAAGLRLNKFSVRETETNICYLNFDLSRIGLTTQYRPASEKFGPKLPYIVEELDESEEVNVVVDTSTGEDPDSGLVYPIEFEQIEFIPEEEAEARVTPEERDTMQDRAVKELARLVSEKLR